MKYLITARLRRHKTANGEKWITRVNRRISHSVQQTLESFAYYYSAFTTRVSINRAAYSNPWQINKCQRRRQPKIREWSKENLPSEGKELIASYVGKHNGQ